MRRKLQQFALVTAAALPLLFTLTANAWSQQKPAQPCEAQPPTPGEQSQNDRALNKSRLADCNGVLRPPAVGDPELVKPAPNVGKMPVIPPSSVPQNGGNSSGEDGNSK